MSAYRAKQALIQINARRTSQYLTILLVMAYTTMSDNTCIVRCKARIEVKSRSDV